MVAGGGAAGSAIVTLLMAGGRADVMVWDREGLLSADDDSLPPAKADAGRIAPTRAGCAARCATACKGADVFIGVSRAPVSSIRRGSRTWRPTAVVFALANPDPEVDPAEAEKYAAVVASGRSDYPNQINNVLAFPGVFRGLLDARASEITTDMLLRAAYAIAHVVDDDELNANFIIPSVFHPEVPKAVAAAISGRATAPYPDAHGRARHPPAAAGSGGDVRAGQRLPDPPRAGLVAGRPVGQREPGLDLPRAGRPDGRGLPDPDRPASTAPARWRSTRSPPRAAPCWSGRCSRRSRASTPTTGRVFTIAFGMLPLLAGASARRAGHPAGRAGAGGRRVRARQGRPGERPSARAPGLGAVARPRHRRAGLAARDDRGDPQPAGSGSRSARTGAGSRRPTTRAAR